jgi:hypothetical protein
LPGKLISAAETFNIATKASPKETIDFLMMIVFKLKIRMINGLDAGGF